MSKPATPTTVPLDGRVVPLVKDAPAEACEHANKVETHFTYGYRWHCPDCKADGESWWD